MQLIHTDRRGIAILSLTHMFTDINQGSVPALIPFLVMQRGFSYTAASGVVMAATLISSILQPILGHTSDRHPLPWLMPLGVLVAGIGIAMSGTATNYWVMIACIMLTGAGVATFHPEGYRFANYVSGENKGTAMSIFSVGGNAGFAIGPVFVTLLILSFGLQGTLFLAIPTTIMALVMWHELSRLVKFRPTKEAEAEQKTSRTSMWPAFIKLSVMIVFRSSLYYGLLTFGPLYLLKVRGETIPQANSVLTVMAIMAVIGTLIGGFLADRIGRKTILVCSLGAIPFCLAGFLLTTGIVSSIFLGGAGMMIAASTTVGIVMGQEYIPNNIGVASGVTTGLAIGLGGVSTPLFGNLADHFGITIVFYILILLPILSVLVALSLPPVDKTILVEGPELAGAGEI
jgi:MFS transporter, FSR family, fosmidomycin resistance protein